MENETRRGYDLPLTTQRWRGWLALAVGIIAVIYVEHQMDTSGFSAYFRAIIWLLYVVMVIPIVLTELWQSLVVLHVVPEGVAVTLFGRTVRQYPREEIRALAGVRYKHKSTDQKWIVLCTRTLEELAELHAGNTRKVFQDSRTRSDWAEAMAGKYLYRYVRSPWYIIRLGRKDLLLIEWSPERLEMLLDMYPGIPWTDLTEKKILDAERNV